MADTKDTQTSPDKVQAPPGVARPVRRVEVLVDNLGPDLLKKGHVTDDPRVVALLKTPSGRKLVREVK